MGRLTVEIEQETKSFYTNRNGHLVVITDGDAADRVSRQVEQFCDKCMLCMASAPVISLGEVKPKLKGSGLFAVGLLEIDNKKKCPLVEHLDLYKMK